MPSHACTTADLFTLLADLFPRFWQRRRGTLGPLAVFISLIRMSVLGTKGYERTLREMKGDLSQILGWRGEPTGSALTQARAKLTEEHCVHAVASVRALCRTAREHRHVDYDGRWLVSFDGSKLSLPAYRSIVKGFGCPKQAPEGPQASLTVLWDVGANQPVDWRLGPYRECERLHAIEMVANLEHGALVLADCNFASRRMMIALAQRGADWLMHVRASGSGTLHEVAQFIASGADDREVVLAQRDHHGRSRPEQGSVTVRLLRLTLPDGTARVFITSLLDTVRHPRQRLVDLYAQRWRVETAFREMKLWYGLQQFHARTARGIYQEVSAVMMFQLLVSELEARTRVAYGVGVTPDGDQPVAEVRTAPIRFNRRLVAWEAIDLLKTPPERVSEQFEDAMRFLWRRRQTPKPGRSFPRERKSAQQGFRDRGPTGRGRPKA
jgi:hypothetical protein